MNLIKAPPAQTKIPESPASPAGTVLSKCPDFLKMNWRDRPVWPQCQMEDNHYNVPKERWALHASPEIQIPRSRHFSSRNAVCSSNPTGPWLCYFWSRIGFPNCPRGEQRCPWNGSSVSNRYSRICRLIRQSPNINHPGPPLSPLKEYLLFGRLPVRSQSEAKREP